MALLPENKISILIGLIVLLGFPAIAQENRSKHWSENEKLSFSDFKKKTNYSIDCKDNFDTCIEKIRQVFLKNHDRLRDEMIDRILKADTERCDENKETCILIKDSIWVSDSLFGQINKMSDSFDRVDTFPNWAESALIIDFGASNNDTSRRYDAISATFFPNESYMLFQSKVLLDHEQIHFDIFEVFARKYRKYFSECIAKGLAVNFNDVYCHWLFNELYNENRAFDRDEQDCKGGGVYAHLINVNRKWRKKVNTELNLLRSYPPGATYSNKKNK